MPRIGWAVLALAVFLAACGTARAIAAGLAAFLTGRR